MNKSFEKVSDSTPKISGYQKACILLSEIGSENNLLRQQIVDILKLSPKEVKKMNHAFKTLGVFNTKNKKVVLRENIVLQEAIDYGVKKGIFIPVEHPGLADGTSKIREMVNQNPDSIAQLIGTWLDE